jgi:cold shock CspA family protein
MVVGTVKSYNVHKGWGFVTHGGKDVFIMASELGGRVVKEGDKLNFTVSQTAKGAQATNIKFVGASADVTYKGEIKSFAHQKGYGFITSEAFPGQDVFVMKTGVTALAAEHLKPGSFCTFQATDGERGPQATNVKLVGAAGKAAVSGAAGGGAQIANNGGMDVGEMWQLFQQFMGGGVPNAGGMQALMGGGMGGGGGSFGGFGGAKGVMKPQFQKSGMQTGTQGTFKVDKSGGELGECIGEIRSFNEKTNYGFIDCPDVAAAGYGDVFLHGDMKKLYKQNMTVKFDCVINSKGKAVAINLRSGLK